MRARGTQMGNYFWGCVLELCLLGISDPIEGSGRLPAASADPVDLGQRHRRWRHIYHECSGGLLWNVPPGRSIVVTNGRQSIVSPLGALSSV